MRRFQYATLSGLTALAAVALASTAPVIAGVPAERQMYVTVMNTNGQAVQDMKQEEFSVTEDGTPRTVTKVERASEPIHYAILIDSSPAAGRAVNDLRAGVKAFCELLLSVEPKTEFLLMEFGGVALVNQDFTSDIAQVEAALGKMLPKPSVDPVLNEALVEASKRFAKMPPTSRKVILTINMEPTREGSGIQARLVAEEVRKSGATLWSIVLQDGPRRDQTREQLLNGLAGNSGGRSVALQGNSLTNLPAYLRSIAANTFQQYLVTFESGDAPAKITDVKVSRPSTVALSMKWSSQ